MPETAISAFLMAQGLGPESVDAEAFIGRFIGEMKRGCRREPSSLAMIPTYLAGGSGPRAGECAVAVDMGGSNLRTALVRFTEGEPVLEGFTLQPTPGTRGQITWQELVETIADAVAPLLRDTDKIGVCISFPTSITPEGDGVIRHFTKEVEITGYENRLLCQELKAALGRPSLAVRALNDTTAVLLRGVSQGADGQEVIGLINGTGTNVCCQVPRAELGLTGAGKMIVAVESGGFRPPARSPIDLLLDSRSASPGVYQEEKLVSGAYLGEICRLALQEAARQGLFTAETAVALLAVEELETPAADAFGAGGPCPLFHTAADAQRGRAIVNAIFARAAKHIACTLTAVLRHTAEPGHPVLISADGSVLKKSALFPKALERYLREYAAAWQPRMVLAENATLIGTAAGALAP